ncbi:MAG: hypothetical protein ACKVZJ_09400 [Phycisphaerales bacterium]
MMRSLWIAVSTLALANLMALGAFALWLNASGRLSRDRIEKVREVFGVTVAQEQSKQAAEKAAVEADAKKAEETAREKRPPISAEQRLAIIREYEETQRQKNERLQRETRDLLNQLDIRRAEFEKQKAEFVAKYEAFQQMREELARNTGSEQFAKTLKVYETVKAADAAAMMESLLAAGDTGREQVVAYLNQMQPRTSAKIVGEFRKKDPSLAADLLERLRTYGLETSAGSGGGRGSTGTDSSADTRASDNDANPDPTQRPAPNAAEPPRPAS